ncbi:hypothetical protein E4F39_21830 [Burkholderia pseudomallei]|nr:hypothetical protein [Burkholderia pseudomallei]MPT70047.1 hypothetical protein [Burkholderia pseudomallei]MPT76714.1 hypothetical protein [Burkholderia pseudomallei]MPT84527.1 hypothetical protein [Burkholderia pseudomallei]MPT90812.1 hypothetical protein [Burkholderia pseudomallei]
MKLAGSRAARRHSRGAFFMKAANRCVAHRARRAHRACRTCSAPVHRARISLRSQRIRPGASARHYGELAARHRMDCGIREPAREAGRRTGTAKRTPRNGATIRRTRIPGLDRTSSLHRRRTLVARIRARRSR